MQNLEPGGHIFLVDESSDLPIWVQLRNRIAYLIRAGYFKPGEQIPSVRSLSTAASINYTTVTKAYKDLERSNLVVSIRGRGMYVQRNAAVVEGPEATVDALVEDCVRQYRFAGVTFDEVRKRLKAITDRLEQEVEEDG